ncbi:MAG: glutaredoxin family protein [Candidatus Nanopelagicales bacterium]
MTPRVRLVGKAGCHLCDGARGVVSRVCADLGVAWEEVSILDDPELADRYWEHIPVTIVDGRVLDHWGVDERRLRAALRADGAAG